MSDEGRKLGEVSWDDVDVKTKGNTPGNGESIFLNMSKEGEYEMRVVSKPYQYYCHWVETKSKKRRKVNATLDGTDPVCIAENKGPQLKWLILVLYRDSEKGSVVRVLDAGSQIMSQIKRLHEDKKRFGNISKYDIVITRGPKTQRPLYTVQALGSERNPTPLTDEEKKMVLAARDSESDSYIDIEKMCQPWTAERILAVINEEDPSKPAPKPAQDDNLLSEEDEKDFLDLDI